VTTVALFHYVPNAHVCVFTPLTVEARAHMTGTVPRLLQWPCARQLTFVLSIRSTSSVDSAGADSMTIVALFRGTVSMGLWSHQHFVIFPNGQLCVCVSTPSLP